MELAFVQAEKSGWRGRGAPRRKVPPHVLEMLRRAAGTREVGVLTPDDDDSVADIKEALAVLRAGARQTNLRITIQEDPAENVVRFRVQGDL